MFNVDKMSLISRFEKLLKNRSNRGIVGDFENGIDRGMKAGYYNGNSSVDMKIVRKIENLVIERATEHADEFVRLYMAREVNESDITEFVKHRKNSLWTQEDYELIHTMCQRRNYQKVQYQKKEILKSLKDASDEFKRGLQSVYELYWFVGAFSNIDIIMEKSLIDRTGLYDIALYDILDRNYINPLYNHSHA